MDSPTPVTQTYIHGDLKFVSNNFIAILDKNEVHAAFHMIHDFLVSSPIGYVLINPGHTSSKSVRFLWKNSSVEDDGNHFLLSWWRDLSHHMGFVIVQALYLPQGSSNVYLFQWSNDEGIHNSIWLFREIWVAWVECQEQHWERNVTFSLIALEDGFTNKCANHDALNHLVQQIGYSLIHNVNFDIATHILEYLGLRIVDGSTAYFARFVDLIFKHLCHNIVFEDDVLLLVFKLNSRFFKDMIGTENRLQFVGNVIFPPHVMQLLQERMPIVHVSSQRVVVQKKRRSEPTWT